MKGFSFLILQGGFKGGLTFGEAVKATHLHKDFMSAVLDQFQQMIASDWFLPSYIPLLTGILNKAYIEEPCMVKIYTYNLQIKQRLLIVYR